MAIGVVAVSMSAPIAAGIAVPALAVAFWRNAIGTAVVAPTLKRDQLTEWRGLVVRDSHLRCTSAAGSRRSG